jgi:Flp pilus assembly pilin Flp
MTDVRNAWDEVGSRLTEIASHVKEQFDARTAFGEPNNEKVEEAVRTLVRAIDNAFTAIGDTLRDPDTLDEAKRTASAVGDAIATTFNDLADRVQRATSRSDAEAEPENPA